MSKRELGTYAQRELELDARDLRLEPMSSRRMMELADGERARMARLDAARMILEEEAQRMATQPILDSPELAYEYLKAEAGILEVEHFWVLCLNRKNRLLKAEVVSRGTASQCLVHPREVFRVAVLYGASAVICCHNHPGGDPAPSSADIKVTRQLREASEALQINLLDHVICGKAQVDPRGQGFYSFQESGLI